MLFLTNTSDKVSQCLPSPFQNKELFAVLFAVLFYFIWWSYAAHTYPLIFSTCSSGTVGNSGHKWMLFIHSTTSKTYQEKCFVKYRLWHAFLSDPFRKKWQQAVSYLFTRYNCVSQPCLLRFRLGQKIWMYTSMLKHHLNELI